MQPLLVVQYSATILLINTEHNYILRLWCTPKAFYTWPWGPLLQANGPAFQSNTWIKTFWFFQYMKKHCKVHRYSKSVNIILLNLCKRMVKNVYFGKILNIHRKTKLCEDGHLRVNSRWQVDKEVFSILRVQPIFSMYILPFWGICRCCF